MDFEKKNFRYVSMKFAELLDGVETGRKLYLRSLSSENRTEMPTDLARDFPDVSDDFRLPSQLQFVMENAHSSPLRISGPVHMWLHYDVSICLRSNL